MDIESLQKIMKNADIPAPDDSAKNIAISAGLSEFKRLAEEKQKISQGTGREVRPIGVSNLFDHFLRSITMKKAYIITGGLSFAALATILVSSTSLFTQVVPIPEQHAIPAAVTPTASAPTVSTPEPAVILPQVAEQVAIKPSDTPSREDAFKKQEPKGEVVAVEKEKDASDKDANKTFTAATDALDAPAPVGAASGARSNAAPAQNLKATSSVEGKSAPSVSRRMQGIAQPSSLPASESVVAPTYTQDAGRDRFESVEHNPVKQVQAEPVSTFSVDVDTASYAFVRNQLNAGVLPQKDAVRLEEMINYFEYDYPLPASKSEPFKPTVTVYPAPWNANHKLVHVGIKGYDLAKKEKPRANLVFLLDVSGSMNEPNKLPLLKQSLRLLVNEMSPEDSVAIVVYAGSAGTVLEPTKGKDKEKIIAALDRLEAGGSTAGGEGIEKAYALAQANFDKEANNRVILATDGDFNVGITDTNELKSFIERKRDTGIFLSVLGFGQGNYNDHLMQTLAQNGNGNASYIDTLQEARKVLVNEAGSTLFTIAKDVKLQVEFNPSTVSEYRLIGYETRMLKREDFNNDKVDAGDIGAGHAVTALYEITPKGATPSMDPLRYQEANEKPVTGTGGNEYAFLKIRYKLPAESESKLLTRPITPADDMTDAKSAPHDLGFAAAVAGFGQLLRGDSYIQNWNYDNVIALAQATKGADEFGYRSEFIQIVRNAKAAAGQTPSQSYDRSEENPKAPWNMPAR